MISEKIGEFQGKVTGRKVLPNKEASPKVKTSFGFSGLMLGVESEIWGTCWSVVRLDGSLYGECPQQGILMTQMGEIGTWTGAGVGHITGEGSAVSFRRQSASTPNRKVFRASGKSPLHMNVMSTRTEMRSVYVTKGNNHFS